MYSILQFLKDKYDTASEISEKVHVSQQELERTKQIFTKDKAGAKQSKRLKIRPLIQKHQIWSVKNEYFDFLGKLQIVSHPFLVLVNNEVDEIEDEDFVRVYVISPFIEMASSNDEICQDASIIGFPFLVEIWNDQPILAELLDEYIGFYEPKNLSFIKSESLGVVNEHLAEYYTSELEKLNSFQKEFRDIEISRSKYLIHSIMALLAFLENKQSPDIGVVISLFNEYEYPKPYESLQQNESTYSLAAKSGINKEDKYLLYQGKSIPFEILFRRDEDEFTLTILPKQIGKLLDIANNEIKGISNSEKSVYSNLKKGLYTLIIDKIPEPLKIRLK